VMVNRCCLLVAVLALCALWCGARAELVYTYYVPPIGQLRIRTTAGEDVVVTALEGKVLVNGAQPETSGTLLTIAASTLEWIRVQGDDGSQTIDLSGVSVGAGFTVINGLALYGEGGDDLLIGGGAENFFRGGFGADQILTGSDQDGAGMYLGEGPDSVTGVFRLAGVTIEGEDLVDDDDDYEIVEDGGAAVMTESGSGEVLRLLTPCDLVYMRMHEGDDMLTAGAGTGAVIGRLWVAARVGSLNIDTLASGIYTEVEIYPVGSLPVTINVADGEVHYFAPYQAVTTLQASGSSVLLIDEAPDHRTFLMNGVSLFTIGSEFPFDYDLAVGDLAGTPLQDVRFYSTRATHVVSAEEYVGGLRVWVEGFDDSLTEIHASAGGNSTCVYGAGYRPTRLEAAGGVARIRDLDSQGIRVTSTGRVAYEIENCPRFEVTDLSSATVPRVDVEADVAMLGEMGKQAGLTVTADGGNPLSGTDSDELTLDASGMPYTLDLAGGKFSVGTSEVSFVKYEKVTVINETLPTPTPTPAPGPAWVVE
jgi:hypothetical protein